NGYFGPGFHHPDDPTIHSFKVDVAEDVLEDLKRRLITARVSHTHLDDSDNFWYGFNSNKLEVFRKYWVDGYSWKRYEAIINSFKQFRTEIEGMM
ncbi:epoxide hydrolase, partial [Oesophagostomum dentatum]